MPAFMMMVAVVLPMMLVLLDLVLVGLALVLFVLWLRLREPAHRFDADAVHHQHRFLPFKAGKQPAEIFAGKRLRCVHLRAGSGRAIEPAREPRPRVDRRRSETAEAVGYRSQYARPTDNPVQSGGVHRCARCQPPCGAKETLRLSPQAKRRSMACNAPEQFLAAAPGGLWKGFRRIADF